jgi:hypothetical protein
MAHWTLILLLFSFPAWAASWRFEGGELDLAEVKDQPGVLLSSSCLKKGCTAKLALNGLLAGLPSDNESDGVGHNPVAALCSGEVIIAAGAVGETRDFCRYSDGSVVSMNGLWGAQ